MNHEQTLSELVARVRAARPELSDRLPKYEDRCLTYQPHWRAPCTTRPPDMAAWPITADAARSIVVGVLAEYAAERGVNIQKDDEGQWWNYSDDPFTTKPFDDYLSALVEAVCKEKGTANV